MDGSPKKALRHAPGGRLRAIGARLTSSAFTANVVKLVGWTVAAQAIYLAFMPILTRLFGKADFGNLGVLQAVSACLIIVAGLRYEVAVLIPEKDEEAFNLVGVTFAAIVVTTAAVTAFCLLAPKGVVFTGSLQFLQDVWWLLPLYQVAATGIELLTNWAIRKRAFDIVARTKMAQIVCQLAVQLGLGLASLKSTGLMIGDVCGRMGGASSLSRLIWREDRALLRGLSWRGMRDAARRYWQFPAFACPAALMGVASRQLPTLVICVCFGKDVTGAFMLAQRVLAAPLELICRAYTQVYLGEGARLSRENPEGLRRLFLKSGGRLLTLGALPALVVAVAGPWLFGVVFGAEWTEGGVYARYLAVMLLANFVAFPLIHTLNILEKQNWQFAWDSATFILGVGGIWVLAGHGAGPGAAVMYYSLVMTAMFAIHYVLSYVAICQRIKSGVQA